MITFDTIPLENAPRTLEREEFHRPELARKGDKWHNPSAGQHDFMIVEHVTKYVSYTYGETWYSITFSNPLPHLRGLRLGEGLGMGTFYRGDFNEQKN